MGQRRSLDSTRTLSNVAVYSAPGGCIKWLRSPEFTGVDEARNVTDSQDRTVTFANIEGETGQAASAAPVTPIPRATINAIVFMMANYRVERAATVLLGAATR